MANFKLALFCGEKANNIKNKESKLETTSLGSMGSDCIQSGIDAILSFHTVLPKLVQTCL